MNYIINIAYLGGAERARRSRIYLAITRLRAVFLACATLFLAGCASKLDRLVEQNDFTREVRPGDPFHHVVISSPRGGPADRLHVYIEGDGRPWSAGRHPSPDPSPRRPLALELMAQDPEYSVYVGRPCYFDLAALDQCTSDDWTFDRYSEAVVTSMARVIDAVRKESAAEEVVLIGYSGGGVLARLVAPLIANVSGVLTVGANLDIEEWARLHGYLPLDGSLNPAAADLLPPAVRHIQVIGDADQVVPRRVTEMYRRNGHALEVWVYPGFDHSCCWVEAWTEILGRAVRLMNDRPR